MITLGLDPSLTGFGWCIHNSCTFGPDRVVAKGVFKTSPKTVFVERYMYLRQAVGELLEAHPQVQNVGVESPPYGEQFSEGLYGLFLYVNEAVFARRKDVVFFDPQSAKMLAKMDPSIRRGKMDKNDMIEAAKVDSGVKRWTHDEADAYLIARSAARFWEFLGGTLAQDELTPAERRAFTRVHTFTRGERAGETVRSGLQFREGDRFFRHSLVARSDTKNT